MEETRRKSSSATIMPPLPVKKASGLRIDCKPVQVMESLEEPASLKGKLKRMISRKKSYTGKVVRHSYSDPRLSPGSTAVGDDDSEQHIGGYFGGMAKKKRSPRGWVAAVMMIVVGALIAITFVLVGLGKALDNHESSKTTTIQVVTVTSTSSIATPTSSVT
ncbi:uncharacterized protein EV154DRAFT_594406 [Mucor mucedo]|uniref:uncharacterized protein n=1 Tax=Mucor mucedo TaxID=29922 RepID=UPI00222085D1|nr:uncharacterized protein EV154DRAFT_594406 [Mucor mucedo]KAI7895769.1 hypothetical protein EV154DRAFT_594406 [Mucor mucedo]